VERITKEDLKRRLDAHERLTLIDVRTQNAWNTSDVQLPDAIRVAPNEVDQHLHEIRRDQLIVTYSADSPGAALLRMLPHDVQGGLMPRILRMNRWGWLATASAVGSWWWRRRNRTTVHKTLVSPIVTRSAPTMGK